MNSIMAKNIEKEALYKELRKRFNFFSSLFQDNKDYHECLSILEQLDEGRKTQQNSAEFMKFIIQDLLDYSQIKAGKFRKNFTMFNIRDTIEKVMNMQSQKAKDKNIKFGVKFKGILTSDDSLMKGFSPNICCDEHRIMQVLLGLQSNALKFTK